MLHTVNKSPFSNGALESCLRFLAADDVILLLEDGVNAAVSGTTKADLIEQALANHEVYAIAADCKARSLNKLIDGVKLVDYDQFVAL
ncbi:MAG: sulfurtransferase complex subunit TusB, partial [Gammaproteobacteria bacterium]|nr:sulfurtransferase complex subunit TusB [Gammaproteobacteria bacterium]